VLPAYLPAFSHPTSVTFLPPPTTHPTYTTEGRITPVSQAGGGGPPPPHLPPYTPLPPCPTHLPRWAVAPAPTPPGAQNSPDA